jgi:hypothetical protein
MQPSNGVLARVPGQYIGQACVALPDAVTAEADEMTVEVAAGWAGRVKLTFTKHRYRRSNAKASYVSWICRRADAVVTPSE